MKVLRFLPVVALLLGVIVSVGVQAPEATAQVRGNHDRIYLRNECNRKIQTAIHVEDINGGWVTKGWYILQPGESAYVADTRNSTFYVYAESVGPKSKRLYWWAEDFWTPVRGSNQSYGFTVQQISTREWGTWTHRFTCY